MEPVEDRDSETRNSDLTFAVIWDPENGALESFSGESLGRLTTYSSDERDLPPPVPHKSNSVSLRAHAWQTRFDRTRRLVARTEHPMNAYRARDPSMLFSDSDSIISSPETTQTETSETTNNPYSLNRPRERVNYQRPYAIPHTPSSELTFAAIWDPNKGFCTLRDGKLIPVSNTPPRPEKRPSKLLYDDFDYSDGGWEMQTDESTQVATPPDSHNVSLATSPSDSDDGYVFRPSESQPFDYPAQYANFCDSPELDSGKTKLPQEKEYTEDEGFFDSFQEHPDCDPHLNSRFSTTTFYTSTSRYLNADLSTPGANSLLFPSIAPAEADSEVKNTKRRSFTFPRQTDTMFLKPMIPRKVSLPASAFPPSRDQPIGQVPGSFKIQTPSMPRLSQVLKAPWAKRRPVPGEEKWVLIDVRAIGK